MLPSGRDTLSVGLAFPVPCLSLGKMFGHRGDFLFPVYQGSPVTPLENVALQISPLVGRGIPGSLGELPMQGQQETAGGRAQVADLALGGLDFFGPR